MTRSKTAFDVFMEFFDSQLKHFKTNERAFDDAAEEWRTIYGFDPPCKNYESFRVKRSVLIKRKEISGSTISKSCQANLPREDTYAALLFG